MIIYFRNDIVIIYEHQVYLDNPKNPNIIWYILGLTSLWSITIIMIRIRYTLITLIIYLYHDHDQVYLDNPGAKADPTTRVFPIRNRLISLLIAHSYNIEIHSFDVEIHSFDLRKYIFLSYRTIWICGIRDSFDIVIDNIYDIYNTYIIHMIYMIYMKYIIYIREGVQKKNYFLVVFYY